MEPDRKKHSHLISLEITNQVQIARNALIQGDIQTFSQEAAILFDLEEKNENIEEFRTEIWNHFWVIFNEVGRKGRIDDQIALCETVIGLAPSPDASMVEEATRSILYLLFDADPARAQPYYRHFFRNQQVVAEPFRDGPPECGVADGPDHASQILAAHGVVLIRGLAPIARCEMIRDEFELVLDRERDRPAYRTFRELENAAYLVKGRTGVFLEQALRPFLSNPKLTEHQSYVRRVDAKTPESQTPFHQDIQAFCAEVVNAWIPLMTCGTTLPGLQFVARRVTEPLPTISVPGDYNYIEIAPKTIREKYEESSLYTPLIALGDVIIFLGSTVHRTHITPAMTGYRTSAEARFTAS